MGVINRKKLLKSYKEVDLYRAKYRHPDLTPHGWCFHGNQIQGWNGYTINQRLIMQGYTSKRFDTLIDASLYKYVSFGIEIPSYWVQKGDTGNNCGLYGGSVNHTVISRDVIDDSTMDFNKVHLNTVSSTVQASDIPPGDCAVGYSAFIGTPPCPSDLNCEWNEKERYDREPIPQYIQYGIEFIYHTADGRTGSTVQEILGGENLVFFDMTLDDNWYGQITKVELFVVAKYNTETSWGLSDIKDVIPIIFVEYFKIDNVNVFTEIFDSETISDQDVNYLRDVIDNLNKDPIDWDGPGNLDDRVAKFLGVIKSSTMDMVEVVRNIPAYNGCEMCDTYTCTCNSIGYEYVPCQACNECDSYQPCSTCDGATACYQQATDCTCDWDCHTEARDCTCDFSCHGVTCTCNGIDHNSTRDT